jgi:hypothetical protein
MMPRFLATSGSYFGLAFLPAASPKIAPLESCYLANGSGRLLELRVSTRPAFVGDLPRSRIGGCRTLLTGRAGRGAEAKLSRLSKQSLDALANLAFTQRKIESGVDKSALPLVLDGLGIGKSKGEEVSTVSRWPPPSLT